MLPSVVEYVHRITELDPRPWLIVGKGPTCIKLPEDRSAYHVLTLNHACTVAPDFAIAHFVDIEAVYACEAFLKKRLEDQKGFLCMPWWPHQDFRPGANNIGDNPGKNMPLMFGAVVAYRQKKRLLSYNASTAFRKPRGPELPYVELRKFGSVAAFNILAMAGVRRIDSFGIDGGTGYSPQFDSKDCLSNGQQSFDAQWPLIDDTLKSYRITYNGYEFK